MEVIDLGIIDYKEAYTQQRSCVRSVIEGGKECLILCEHFPVLTLGRLASYDHVLVSKEDLEKKGIFIYDINRGGEVTLHAPGQLIGYPILNLNNRGKDLHKYIRNIESLVIDVLREFDVYSIRSKGQTGVWVDDKKIASIGIGVKKWVSFHGVSINISTDLNLFRYIRPCGLNVRMTSLNDTKKEVFSIPQVKDVFIQKFKMKFCA